jgi:uncharacterized protein (TIGR00369 family)
VIDRSAMEATRVNADEFEHLVRSTAPGAERLPFRVTLLERGRAVLTLPFAPEHLRAGGSVSGPTLFMLADTALYAAVLSEIGLSPLAVTTDMTIHFVKKAREEVVAEAMLLRCGRSQAVGTVSLRTTEGVVAHATGTYALPPR